MSITILLTDTNLTEWAGVATDGTDIIVQCIGGGAGGAKGDSGWVGAGGGEWRKSTIPYASGSVVTGIQIGKGGIGATTNSLGTDGEETHWNTDQIVAKQGLANRWGGTGGTGDTGNNGGDGAAGSIGNYSGGGGAGGEVSAGGPGLSGNPLGNAGGSGGFYSGQGGYGDDFGLANHNGSNYGGGGGQGFTTNGGNGGQGVIIITYTPAPIPDLTRKKMRFFNGGNYVDVDVPVYPYSCEIVMPISSVKDSQGSPTFFDPPASHGDDTLGTWDYRLLNTGTWRLPSDQQIALSAFFKDADKGRGENVTMTLQTGSGFFPFGPDLGDSGNFVVRLLEQSQSGRLGRPWNYFENAIYLVLITAPGGYSLPPTYSEGPFSIGSVSGLQFVDFAPKTFRNIQHQLTASGVPYSMDGKTSGDSYEVGFSQLCNQGNAAALVSFLVSTSGRASDITIIASANFYLFGVDNGSNGTYTTKFLGASPNEKTVSIKMTNERFNQWIFPLNFWMKSVT
jgi:hypothetical protein